MIAEGDLVAVYFIFESKHTGTPFAGVPATGNPLRFLMMLLRISDGKIDVHDILRQLGVTA
ncbi:ester cyclase [Bacillus vallismortis]|uniref:ester cyclase n=1 Tax=Bacillus vallismortis TaxID=72361 RepID=UPI0034613618